MRCPPLLLLVALFALPARAAVMIPIVNPSFEDDTVAPNTFPVVPAVSLPGWTAVDPGGILASSNNAVGVINPTGSTFYPGGAPDGDNAAIIFLGDNIGTTPVSLTQVLTDSLQANTRYTLTVEVGNIASGTGSPPFDVFGPFDLDGFPGYRVQLLAGGEVIAEDDNELFGSIPEGTFATSVVEVTIPEAHPQLGEPLEVRLTNLNEEDTPEDPGIEVNFDNVRLDANEVPEPASSAMLLACALYLCPRRPHRG